MNIYVVTHAKKPFEDPVLAKPDHIQTWSVCVKLTTDAIEVCFQDCFVLFNERAKCINNT